MFRGAVGQIASLGISLMTKPDGRRPDTPLLDPVSTPVDLRRLQPGQLRQLADALRAEMIDAVSVTGGPLGAGRGVRSEERRVGKGGVSTCWSRWSQVQ